MRHLTKFGSTKGEVRYGEDDVLLVIDIMSWLIGEHYIL